MEKIMIISTPMNKGTNAFYEMYEENLKDTKKITRNVLLLKELYGIEDKRVERRLNVQDNRNVF